MSLLMIDQLVAGYTPGVDILNGLCLQVEAHSITGIIGPNGAGKSTLLKTVFGLLTPSGGQIRFNGNVINAQLPAVLKRLGISYFPQGSNIFPHMTVEENLRLSCWSFKTKPDRVRAAIDRARALFPILHDKRKSKASLLSGGEAKMLSLAKEIISEPRLMLVDEPSAGLAPKITHQVYEFLEQSRQSGITILLVDQNIHEAVQASDYLYMLDMGRVRVEGAQDRFATNLRDLIRDSLIGS
ncbi:High-affinity branched-chain amino acid transport ATP-binding protein LivF [Candidatus Entotheonellaceae bacterium PAL068K]